MTAVPAPVRHGVLQHPRRRWLIGAVVALLFAVFLLPGHQKAQFWVPDSREALLLRCALGIAFTGALTALVAFVLKFVERVRAGDPRYRATLLIAGAYLLVALPLWVLTWPGEWVNDEFWIAHLAESWQADGWQGYLTIVFYTFAMFLYPSAVVVVLVQLVFGAIVVGRFAAVVHELAGRRRAAFLVIVPLLSPAVLVNLLYPMRAVPYAFLLLLVVTELLALRGGLSRSVGRNARFIGLGVAVDILATWRSEGAVLLVLLPVLLVALGLHRQLRRSAAARGSVAVVAGVLLLLSSINSALSSPAYGIVATVNPVTGLVNGPLRGDHVQRDLAVIDPVIPVSAMREYPSYTDVDAYWNAGLRPGYERHVGAYYGAVADLVLANPMAFAHNRLQVLLAANALDQEMPVIHPEHLQEVAYGDEQFSALSADDPVAQPTDAAQRLRTLQTLFLAGSDGSITFGTRILFNALPALLGLLGLSVAAAIRRRWFWSALSALLLAQAGFVVLAAPGALFMYFLPTYVAGTAVLTSAAAIQIAHRSARSVAAPEPRALSADEDSPAAHRLHRPGRSRGTIGRPPLVRGTPR